MERKNVNGWTKKVKYNDQTNFMWYLSGAHFGATGQDCDSQDFEYVLVRVLKRLHGFKRNKSDYKSCLNAIDWWTSVPTNCPIRTKSIRHVVHLYARLSKCFEPKNL